jgi:hypothetical protein
MTLKRTCDNCGKEMEYDTIRLYCGYGSKFDSIQCKNPDFDFCSDKCLKEWVNNNIS